AYNLGFRVAAGVQGGTFHLEVDGADITGPLTVPNTGGYQTGPTVNKKGVSLAAGTHVLRLALDAAGAGPSVGNFNAITVSPQVVSQPTQTPFTGTPIAISNSTTSTIQFE